MRCASLFLCGYPHLLFAQDQQPRQLILRESLKCRFAPGLTLLKVLLREDLESDPTGAEISEEPSFRR